MVFPVGDDFIIGNEHFRLKYRRNDRKPLKLIENRCSHWALRLILIGKDADRKGNIKHVRTWSQAISSNSRCLFRSKIAKIAKDKCSRCAMDLDYCFRRPHRIESSLCGYTTFYAEQEAKTCNVRVWT